jgi:glycopeptide antibiotics resistance protein
VIRSRRLAGVLLAIYLLVVAFIVFLPTAGIASGSVHAIWSALQAAGAPGWVTPDGVEFVTNTLLFVPLSLLGHTFRPHWAWMRWLLAGLAGTLLIEAVQMVLLPDRSAALIDVIANTLGAVVGYAVVVLLTRGRVRL